MNKLSHLNMLAVELQSDTPKVSKSQNSTLNCNLDELAILRFVKENPDATTPRKVHLRGVVIYKEI